MTFTPTIYVKSKLEDTVHCPPAKTPEPEIWKLMDMGQALEEVVAGITPESTVVDSALSSESENPVQNKVINSALGNKAGTDLTNVNVGSENAGKYLIVNSDGTLTYVTLPTELPAYTSSDENKVLSVNSEGQLIWKLLE